MRVCTGAPSPRVKERNERKERKLSVIWSLAVLVYTEPGAWTCRRPPQQSLRESLVCGAQLCSHSLSDVPSAPPAGPPHTAPFTFESFCLSSDGAAAGDALSYFRSHWFTEEDEREEREEREAPSPSPTGSDETNHTGHWCYGSTSNVNSFT